MIQQVRQNKITRAQRNTSKLGYKLAKCAYKTKKINIDQLKTEVFCCPEWERGPEDVVQMNILTDRLPSAGFDNQITAIDVFPRFLFAYPTTQITAPVVARVIMDMPCKHM